MGRRKREIRFYFVKNKTVLHDNKKVEIYFVRKYFPFKNQTV